MANSVGNNVWVRGPRGQLQRFMDAVREQPPPGHPDPLFDLELERSWLSLNHIIPVPDEIPDTISFQMIDGKLDWVIWQEWLHEHWGTKWIHDVDVRWLSATELHYFFNSAWNPPLPLFDHLARRFPRLAFSLDATDLNGARHWQAEWSNGTRNRSAARRMSRATYADVRMAECMPADDEDFQSVLADYTAGYRHRRREELHLKRGLVYLQWGKAEKAAEEIGRAIRLDETYAAAYTQRAVAHRELRSFDRAEADHRSAIRLTPKDAEAHYEYGRTLFARGELAEGLRCGERAIEADAYFAPAHAFLANFYSNADGLAERAGKYFTRVLELHPTDFFAHRDYADLLARLGECEQAALHYTEAMRLRKLTSFLLLRRGICFLVLGQAERAARDFTRLAQDRWPESLQKAGSLLQGLAGGFEKGRATALGRVRKALQAIDGEEWARRVIGDSWENFAAGLHALGVRSWKSGDFRTSLRRLRMAALADPDNPEYLALWAWALATCPEAGLRDGRRAATLAQRSVRSVKPGEDPGHALLSVLAAALAAAGDYARAAECQQAAIGALPKKDNQDYLVEWCSNGFRFLVMDLFWPYKLDRFWPEGTIHDGLLRAYRRRLRLYRANKTFHLRAEGRGRSDRGRTLPNQALPVPR